MRLLEMTMGVMWKWAVSRIVENLVKTIVDENVR